MSTLLFLKTSSLSANRKLKRQMFFLDSKGLMFSSPGNFQKFLLPVEIIFTHLQYYFWGFIISLKNNLSSIKSCKICRKNKM